MLKQQDLINKANEDFVKFKARLMHLGKEQVFQQSEKIELAKKVRRMLTYPNQMMDNITYHKFMDMENIYDVFYKFYKERLMSQKILNWKMYSLTLLTITN